MTPPLQVVGGHLFCEPFDQVVKVIRCARRPFVPVPEAGRRCQLHQITFVPSDSRRRLPDVAFHPNKQVWPVGAPGKAMPRFSAAGKQVMDPITAYQTVHMLEGVVQRGTATILRDLDRPLFGKTGARRTLALNLKRAGMK